MASGKSWFRARWFPAVMSVASIGMVASYARLVLTTDDSPRRIAMLAAWGVIAIAWTVAAVVRLRAGSR